MRVCLVANCFSDATQFWRRARLFCHRFLRLDLASAEAFRDQQERRPLQALGMGVWIAENCMWSPGMCINPAGIITLPDTALKLRFQVL
jgi:hypothetical protein